MFLICFEGCEKRKMDKHPISLRSDDDDDTILTPEQYDQLVFTETRDWFDGIVKKIEKTLKTWLRQTVPLSGRMAIEFFSHEKMIKKKKCVVVAFDDVYRKHYYECFKRSPQYLTLVEKFKQEQWVVEVYEPSSRFDSDIYVGIRRGLSVDHTVF